MEFYQTPSHPCGYFKDRFSANIFADPNQAVSTQTYSWLIDYGFRRNGSHLYRPHCPSCSACVPTRVPVNNFTPNRSQLRTLRQNQDLDIKILPNEFSQQYFDLYKQYLIDRHQGSPMEQSTIEDYKEFIIGSWSSTFFLEVCLENKLIAIAVFDVLPQGLSAVYTFYDNTFVKRGLGNFAILKLIQETKKRSLPYLYLGYWIEDCKKMSYKKNYKPIQGYINKIWQEI